MTRETAGEDMARVEGNLAPLLWSLSGAQANDSGWPTFKGKYMEYPKFEKEWWAYRRTYHACVRDELTFRSLKDKCLLGGGGEFRPWMTIYEGELNEQEYWCHKRTLLGRKRG
jgi:hypothetical protein